MRFDLEKDKPTTRQNQKSQKPNNGALFRHWFYHTSFNVFYCGVCSISGLVFVLCYFHCYPILVCLFSFVRVVCSSLSFFLAVLHVRAFFVLSSSGLCFPFHVGFRCRFLWKSIILSLFVSLEIALMFWFFSFSLLLSYSGTQPHNPKA